ncbi:MAG: polysaccharide biosynthesis/export family protein [Longimicrobiales bacterium]
MKGSIRMRCSIVLPAFVLMATHATAVVAQDTNDLDSGLLFATRAQLEAILGRYEEAGDASGYSDAVRTIANDEADLIRYRLTEGDFEVGDQITLTVSGNAALTNQFTVAPGKLLILPEIPEMPLRGLLRSELSPALAAHLSKYYVNPQVFVTTSIRLQVEGEVGNPGFHVVSADQRFPDMLASVGQPTRTARTDEIKITRGNETIWDGDELQQAIVEGRTLDQLNLRAGDIIEVPAQSTTNFLQTLRAFYFIVPLGFALSRIF